MSAFPAAVPPPSPALHARRCVRHPGREAAARCPGCQEFYCRECVVEHDGRLLCRTCLQRETKVVTRRHERWRAVRRVGAMLAGFIVLWIAFGTLGALLLRIPPGFHDGTVWKRMYEHSRP